MVWALWCIRKFTCQPCMGWMELGGGWTLRSPLWYSRPEVSGQASPLSRGYVRLQKTGSWGHLLSGCALGQDWFLEWLDKLKKLMLTHSLGSLGLSLSLRPINTNCGHDMWKSTLSLRYGEEWLYFVEFTNFFLPVHRNKVYSLNSSTNSIQHLMNAWIIYLLGLQVSRLTTVFIMLLNKTTLIMPLICEN